jgi:DNA-binding response OmpR family regulator
LPWDLRFVNDGEQAMDYLKGKPPFTDRALHPMPDLLILALSMTNSAAFDVLEWMNRSGFRRIPVIVLSSFDRQVDRARALSLGAREYLVKSADTGEIITLLKELKR